MNPQNLSARTPIAERPAAFLRSDTAFDLARLQQEVAHARSILDFNNGPYGNAISLPAARDVPPAYREHHNNLPFANALSACPYLQQLFDSFPCPKASFRLLIRRGRSAYSFHDDKDKGSDVIRMQIPIITSDHAFMVLPRMAMRFDCVLDAAAGDGDVWFDLAKLERLAAGQFDLYTLAPGRLYWFDTDRIHTLINASDQDRIVLSIDAIRNEALNKWMADHLNEPVLPSSTARSSHIRWQWNALRNGVIRTASMPARRVPASRTADH